MALAGLTGCASHWMRPDGAPVSEAQLQLDQTVCKGETQKATLAHGGPSISVVGGIAWEEAYAGCMAGKGYLQQR